jgi:6-pyruvoyltetrahydropterin/6-carboxytetrahydropterin synthase
MSNYISTKVIELGSCAFRQWKANHSRCQFIHGYQLKAKIWFGCSYLDEKNWAVDFGGLKEIKKLLQEQFDHTTCVDQADPELQSFIDLNTKGIIDLRIMPDGVGIERTAEFVFKLVDSQIREQTNNRCWVIRTEVFEHEENSAIYQPPSVKPTQTVATWQAELNDSTESAVSLTADQLELDLTQTINSPQAEQRVQGRGANVGNNVSEGKSNWFAGTSWG